MSEHSPITIMVTYSPEDAQNYPDMLLRLLIRQAVLGQTGRVDFSLDEAVQVLEQEVDYLRGRIRNAAILPTREGR